MKSYRKANQKPCPECNSPIELDSKSCRGCSSGSTQIKELSLGQYQQRSSVKGKDPSWKNVHIRTFCRSWNKPLTKHPCQKCGYTLHVELAHIKPVASFSVETKIGDINSPDNLVVLCPNCHWEFDNGYLPLNQIPKRSFPPDSNRGPSACRADALTN